MNENISEAFHAIAKEICVCIENDKIKPVKGPGVGQSGMKFNSNKTNGNSDKKKKKCC